MRHQSMKQQWFRENATWLKWIGQGILWRPHTYSPLHEQIEAYNNLCTKVNQQIEMWPRAVPIPTWTEKWLVNLEWTALSVLQYVYFFVMSMNICAFPTETVLLGKTSFNTFMSWAPNETVVCRCLAVDYVAFTTFVDYSVQVKDEETITFAECLLGQFNTIFVTDYETE